MIFSNKKVIIKKLIFRLQRSCLHNKGKIQPRNIVIDGSASLQKYPKNEQTNTKIYDFNDNCASIWQMKTLKKSKYFLSATCWVKWQITKLSFTMIYIIIFSKEFRSIKMQF